MRFAALAFLTVLMALSPLQARAQNAMFSGFYCRQRVACDSSDPTFPQAAELAQIASNCITQNLGTTSATGYFEEAAGVDANGCLTTKTDAFSEAGGSRTVPQCCIKQIPVGGCAIHCDMLSE